MWLKIFGEIFAGLKRLTDALRCKYQVMGLKCISSSVVRVDLNPSLKLMQHVLIYLYYF